MNLFIILLTAFISFATTNPTSSCLKPGFTAATYDEWGFPTDTLTSGDSDIKNADDELNLIYSLLTYAVVYKTWQTDDNSNQPLRGHNYGAVLIKPNNEIAHWGRNENFATHDETQHAETRAIQQYIKISGVSNLKGYTIHVGGDSCPMCAGMISQQQIKRAVLGLSNPSFGKNFDRMNLDSRDCGNDHVHGLAPIVRKVKPSMSPSEIRKQIDEAFRSEVIKSCGGHEIKTCKNFPDQTGFLKSQIAFEIFKKAHNQLLNYKVKFANDKAINSQKTNEQLYQDAIMFLNNKVRLL